MSDPFHPQNIAGQSEWDGETFPGKTKLFIGGLPADDFDQSQLQELLAPYGEMAECYLPPRKGFGIVTMSSREKAYKAMVGLNGTPLGDRILRVRPSPDAAVWIGDLPSICTNELLHQGFSRFGPINRAIVCCDTRGRSLGYGFIEFAFKGSAANCLETTSVQSFLLSKSPQPVRVEPFKYKEEDVGLPSKDIMADRFYWAMLEAECNGPGPRISAEPISMEWLKLYQQERIAKHALRERFVAERQVLLDKQRNWFNEEELERQRQADGIRSQRLEIMKREEQLRKSQQQLAQAAYW